MLRLLTSKSFSQWRSAFPPSTRVRSQNIGPRALNNSIRLNSSDAAKVDVVAQLQSNLKIALKAKDSLSSTTIRSVLAEIYAAQKVAVQPLNATDIVSIIRKAEQRRLDSARQFEDASRADLAEKERKEAELLASYLPTMIPVSEIDAVLRRIISGISEKDNIKKAKGLALKSFYSEVDKNVVQSEVVKQRLDQLWSS